MFGLWVQSGRQQASGRPMERTFAGMEAAHRGGVASPRGEAAPKRWGNEVLVVVEGAHGATETPASADPRRGKVFRLALGGFSTEIKSRTS